MLVWLREAAQHVDAVNNVLLKDLQIKRGRLDGMWLFIQNRGQKYPARSHESAETGEFMRSTMLDIDSRLRAATAVEKNETLAS